METGNFLKTLFLLELIILASFVFQEEIETQTSMFWKGWDEKKKTKSDMFSSLWHPGTIHFLTVYWPTGVSIN